MFSTFYHANDSMFKYSEVHFDGWVVMFEMEKNFKMWICGVYYTNTKICKGCISKRYNKWKWK